MFTLSNNVKKVALHRSYIRQNVSIDLHERMEYVVLELKHLHSVKKLLETNLVPQIIINKNDERDELLNYIMESKLVHKYKWEKFGAADYMELLEYVLKQEDDWQLNQKTLDNIFHFFKGRFSPSLLQRKLFKYGIDYNFD